MITGEWVGEITYIGPERRKFLNIRRAIDTLTPYLGKATRLLDPDVLRRIDEDLGRQSRSMERAARSGGKLSTEAVIRGYSNLAPALPKQIAETRLAVCPSADISALEKLKPAIASSRRPADRSTSSHCP